MLRPGHVFLWDHFLSQASAGRRANAEPLAAEVDWLVNGAGAFEIGGPAGDYGLSGKKLVDQAYGTAVPIGGGATFGKDPRIASLCTEGDMLSGRDPPTSGPKALWAQRAPHRSTPSSSWIGRTLRSSPLLVLVLPLP